MKEEELMKGLTYLGMAYGKEYTKIELDQHYDFLKDYSYETFIVAIKSIIRTSKFLPKITELLEECEKHKEQVKNDVVEFMRKQGYFKIPVEYEKVSRWLEIGIIPEWFRNDMNRYYKMMRQETLDHKETLMIGW